MKVNADLNRFLLAQESTYNQALAEIRKGRKQSHWMWFIFPQIKGLGISETSKFYSIEDLDEAREYLNHPVLGSRLNEISKVLINLPGSGASYIFGSPDDVKLKSSMTLFDFIAPGQVFEQVLKKFFMGERDQTTLKILSA